VPRIAVVIPCYNDGATVRDALESARAQEPCEIVIVDDGSTDEATRLVLGEIAGEERARVVRQDNAGLSAARMTGVRESSAPYVYPLDSDDVLAPHTLARLADALDANPGAVAAWGDEETFGGTQSFMPGAPALDPWRITYFNEISGAVIRRKAIVEVGGWELQEGYEDWDLWMKFAARGWEGVYVPGPMIRYRVHESRMLKTVTVPRHGRIYADLQRRHADLFARRRASWRRSAAPWRLKLLLPLVGALPFVSAYGKHRLYGLVRDPVTALRLRLRGGLLPNWATR
jgi:glycosyltransferase involved in cell wall biosynthesis